MKQLQKKFYNAARQVVLRDDEKARIKAVLMKRMGITPESLPKPSPFVSAMWMRFSALQIRTQYISLFVLTLLICGGVSLSAQYALPGQPLYQVKTYVNENIVGLFALTPESKAQFQAQLAVQGLQEVEQLANIGGLDATTSADAEQSISQHLAVAKDNVLVLEQQNNDQATDTSSTSTNLTVSSATSTPDNFATTTLEATTTSTSTMVTVPQSAATTTLLVATTTSTSTTPSVLENLVSSSTVATSSDTTSTSTDDNLNSLDTTASTSATTTLEDASTTLPGTDQASSSVATSTLLLQTKFAEATVALKTGEDQITAKSYQAAYASFQKAQDIAKQIKVILDAEQSVDTTLSSTATTTSMTSQMTASVGNVVLASSTASSSSQ